jgi:type I restriction enzyme S subunit
MQRYNTYKDSGVKWLGEIPSHWEMRKMKFSFEERSQKGFPNLPLLAATQNHGVIRKTDYENRTVEATKSLDTLKLVEIGDFVISLRSFQGGIELCYEKGIISPAYTILRPTHITAGYFKHLGKSPIFIQLLKSMVTGIREGQNIDYGKLRENLLPIPPIAEQTAIANYLDTITAKIDAAIAQQQKMIDLLNERKQIIINRAVTGNLQCTMNNEQCKMKDSGVEWIGEVPEGWKVRRLKHVFRKISDGTHFSPNTISEGYPYITATDVNGRGIDYDLVKRISAKDYDALVASGCKIEKGDILLVKDGATTGRVGMKTDEVSCVALSSVAMLTPSRKDDNNFLMYVMMSDILKKQIVFPWLVLQCLV